MKFNPQDASGLSGGNPRDQRIGRVMLNHGSNIKSAHFTYWANHPKAVCILENYRDELDAFMESKYFCATATSLNRVTRWPILEGVGQKHIFWPI